MWYLRFIEKNLIPEPFMRFAIRRMIRKSIKNEPREITARLSSKIRLIEDLKQQPIAIHTDTANEQHYELPANFFELILGNHLKYSSCFWEDLSASITSVENLVSAEEKMLEITCQRAEVKDGETILDLGCGWGSLSLYLAKKYPKSKIVALSNSLIQKQFIDSRISQESITNLEVITANIGDFTTEMKFDRIISIEMFEHMRNYQLLMQKLASFLKPTGKLFVHIFTRQYLPHIFIAEDDSSFMGKYFFAGGTMPSDDLLLYFAKDFYIEKQWAISGVHYSKTLNAWLWKMKQHKEEILPILERVYGKRQTKKWWVFWKIFFLANAEIFGYNNGQEYFVSHYLFKPK